MRGEQRRCICCSSRPMILIDTDTLIVLVRITTCALPGSFRSSKKVLLRFQKGHHTLEDGNCVLYAQSVSDEKLLVPCPCCATSMHNLPALPRKSRMPYCIVCTNHLVSSRNSRVSSIPDQDVRTLLRPAVSNSAFRINFCRSSAFLDDSLRTVTLKHTASAKFSKETKRL